MISQIAFNSHHSWSRLVCRYRFVLLFTWLSVRLRGHSFPAIWSANWNCWIVGSGRVQRQSMNSPKCHTWTARIVFLTMVMSIYIVQSLNVMLWREKHRSFEMSDGRCSWQTKHAFAIMRRTDRLVPRLMPFIILAQRCWRFVGLSSQFLQTLPEAQLHCLTLSDTWSHLRSCF